MRFINLIKNLTRTPNFGDHIGEKWKINGINEQNGASKKKEEKLLQKIVLFIFE